MYIIIIIIIISMLTMRPQSRNLCCAHTPLRYAKSRNSPYAMPSLGTAFTKSLRLHGVTVSVLYYVDCTSSGFSFCMPFIPHGAERHRPARHFIPPPPPPPPPPPRRGGFFAVKDARHAELCLSTAAIIGHDIMGH